MKKYEAKYKIKKIYTDTYSISDSGLGQGPVYMYLLVGNEKALLIDSGYGILDLKEAVKTVTDKEVICICTHGHVDHALGACQFENAYLHSNDLDVYRRHTDVKLLSDIGYKGIMKLPKRRLKNDSYLSLVRKFINTAHSPLKTLDNYRRFDLGERTISWHLVPGHTQGSIALLDEKHNTVFDGDSAPLGAWLFLEESSGLAEYAAALKNYYTFLIDRKIKKRFVGHSGIPMSVKSIKNLINCVKTAEKNPSKGIKVNALFTEARIVIAKGSVLFCRR